MKNNFGKQSELRAQTVVFFLLLILCAFNFFSSELALLIGIVFALTLKNPYPVISKKAAKSILSLSIVLMGAGLNLVDIRSVGTRYFFMTVIGLSSTLVFAFVASKLIRIPKKLGALIGVGTSICGGSAIAALSPSIEANDDELAISLATVFSLNALALIIFPLVGRLLELTPEQFGVWAALAIHDTSSVVGATHSYDPISLEIGTTVKLARALWIVPIVIGASIIHGQFFKSRRGSAKIKQKPSLRSILPWFILGFIISSALVSVFPEHSNLGKDVADVGKNMFPAVLFLVGSQISLEKIKSVGLRVFAFGMLLWVFSALLSLFLIFNFS